MKRKRIIRELNRNGTTALTGTNWTNDKNNYEFEVHDRIGRIRNDRVSELRNETILFSSFSCENRIPKFLFRLLAFELMPVPGTSRSLHFSLFYCARVSVCTIHARIFTTGDMSAFASSLRALFLFAFSVFMTKTHWESIYLLEALKAKRRNSSI